MDVAFDPLMLEYETRGARLLAAAKKLLLWLCVAFVAVSELTAFTVLWL